MTKRPVYLRNHDAELNQQFIDSLRECLGKEPLYSPVTSLTRQCSPTFSLAHGERPLVFLRSDMYAGRHEDRKLLNVPERKATRDRLLHMKGSER